MTNPGALRGVTGWNLGDLDRARPLPATVYRPASSPPFGATLTRTSSGWAEQVPGVSIYNLTPSSCPRWKAAVARATTGGAIAHLLCRGDSLTANGQGFSLIYPGFLQALLDTDGRYGRVRRGVIPVTTTTAAEAGNGFAFQSFTSWSWTPSFNVSRFTIYYVTNPPSGASTFTWALNGGSTTTIDTSVGASQGVGSFSVTAGSVGSHTLALAKVGAPAVYVLGAEAWDDSIPWRMKVTADGAPGSPSNDLTNLSAINYGTPAYGFAPDISLIKFGANDQSAGNLRRNLVSEVNYARNVVGSDAMLIASNTFGGAPGPWPAKRDAIYLAAEEAGVPVSDVDRRWADLPAALRTTFNANDHPTAAGLSDEARLHFAALTALA